MQTIIFQDLELNLSKQKLSLNIQQISSTLFVNLKAKNIYENSV